MTAQQQPLTDHFGRQFQYLRLSITDVCNFRCQYCLPDGYQCDSSRDFLSLKEIETLVNAFVRLGTRKIRITGGEPGLRKDLSDIIRLCKQTPGIEQVAMTSNGFNLASKAEEWAFAGLDSLNISVDSLDPRLFQSLTGHNNLQQILDGLQIAHQAGIGNIKLNAVLLKGFNLQQVPEYIQWLRDKTFTLRFIELMETGDNPTFFEQQHVSGEQIKQQLAATGWQPVLRHKLAGPAQEFYHPDYQGRVGLIMPYSKDFCRSCNRLRISATGKLHLCLFAEQGIDIRQGLADGDVQGTISTLQQAMGDKAASHELGQHLTGATKHLAMLGG